MTAIERWLDTHCLVQCGRCGKPVKSGTAHFVVNDGGTLYCPRCCPCKRRLKRTAVRPVLREALRRGQPW